MVVLGGGLFLISEVPLYTNVCPFLHTRRLSLDTRRAFRGTSLIGNRGRGTPVLARLGMTLEPLPRHHPEAGSWHILPSHSALIRQPSRRRVAIFAIMSRPLS